METPNPSMIDLEKLVKLAEGNLNDSIRHLDMAKNPLTLEFVELNLQANIFQYDVCTEMVSVLRNQPEGFACCVALKDLVLKLFEYNLWLDKSLVPRLKDLAKRRGLPIESSTIKELRKKWKSELVAIRRWSDVRNQAAGHYSPNLQKQIALLHTLELDSVLSVANGFLSFNMSLLKYLQDAGRGVGRLPQ